MKILYDNEAYRDEFMAAVYSLLNDDPTNDRANQIIDLFDAAPAITSQSNNPLTLEELQELEGGAVWVEDIGVDVYWGTVLNFNDYFIIAHCNDDGYDNIYYKDTYGKTWLAYRRKPKEEKHDV